MTITIAQGLSRFITHTRFEDVPSEAIEVAKRCIVDGMGVMNAGSHEPCATLLRRYAAETGGTPEAWTYGAGAMRVPMQMSALLNGTAGHALDYDDTALSREADRAVLIHPTMQPLCAALAVAETTNATGRDFLAAFVLGFEVQVKIAEAINAEHFTGGRGFHTSGTLGIFGATATAARLLGLTQEQTTNALAIATTMSSGIGANHGTMSKPLNMGISSEHGVTAVRMAQLGFDGNPAAFETGRGFFEAFAGGFDRARLIGRLGAPWAILDPGTSVKPYPCGVVGHPGMDAMLSMVTTHDIHPDEVAHISVRTGENTIFPGPLRIEHANSALDGKFCVPFQMAAIVLRRKAGLAEFSDDFVTSTACQEMQKRIHPVLDPQIVAKGKDRIIFDITLETTDGRRFTGQSAPTYRGGPDNPLTWEALTAKFDDCAQSTLDQTQRRGFLAQIQSLDTRARAIDVFHQLLPAQE